MGLEGFIAAGQALLVVVAFALVILGVSVVWAFGPIMVMPGNPTGVGFLLVLLIALVIVRAFAICIGAFGTVIRTSPIVVLIALLLAEPVKTAHMVDDELSRRVLC